MNATKDTNPKDAVGTGKVPLSTVPAPVIAEIGLAMLEGARKYGRHNYRVAGIRFSVYYDAAMRHLMSFWEGEDVDPDSGLSHVTKALATLTVLRDAMIRGLYVDDRPPQTQDWVPALNFLAKEIIAKYPNAVAPYTALNAATAACSTPPPLLLKVEDAVRSNDDGSLGVIQALSLVDGVPSAWVKWDGIEPILHYPISELTKHDRGEEDGS